MAKGTAAMRIRVMQNLVNPYMVKFLFRDNRFSRQGLASFASEYHTSRQLLNAQGRQNALSGLKVKSTVRAGGIRGAQGDGPTTNHRFACHHTASGSPMI